MYIFFIKHKPRIIVINISFGFNSVRVPSVDKGGEKELGVAHVFDGVMEIPDTIPTLVLDISLSLSRAFARYSLGVGAASSVNVWVWMRACVSICV